MAKINYLQAPFPYFGGKARVAHLVWDAIGDVNHYMEPFFGSGAVLLARPNYDPSRHVETVNDADGHIVNVWRALKYNPQEVAKYCDWMPNHVDLYVRRQRILREEKDLLAKMAQDEEYYDPRLAGYWIWCTSLWIGGGMLTKNKSGVEDNSDNISLGKMPHLGDGGMGVHKISIRGASSEDEELITQKKLPSVSLGGLPHLAGGGRGVHKVSIRKIQPLETLLDWFNALAERLRFVRVVNGDWSRICGGNWQNHMGTVGIFFDPPYSADRTAVYRMDDFQVSAVVRKWCIERGALPDYRIVLAGYRDEHAELLNYGWKSISWSSNGYANIARGISRGKENRTKETLFFSPHCLNNKESVQKTLW